MGRETREAIVQSKRPRLTVKKKENRILVEHWQQQEAKQYLVIYT